MNLFLMIEMYCLIEVEWVELLVAVVAGYAAMAVLSLFLCTVIIYDSL